MKTEDEVVKSVPVYETTDYKKFKLIKGNRERDKGHVKSLINSLNDNGNRILDDPIEVNEEFMVLDGQHRLQALEKLQMPVCYIVRSNMTVKDIRIANSYRKNWGWYDYAVSYRDELDNIHYKQFLELFHEGHHAFRILMLYSGYKDITSIKTVRTFAQGDFVMKNFEETKRLLGMYDELAEAARIRNREFAIACYKFMNNSTYNHQHMLTKLKTHRKALLNCYFANDYLFTLQDIWRA